MFLDEKELAQLTGYKKKRPLQKQWLKDNSIPFVESATGHIKVLRKAVEERLGCSSGTGRRSVPNYSSLEVQYETYRTTSESL